MLRPMRQDDAPALFAILGDGPAMAHWDRAPLPRLATVEAQLADELAAMDAGGFHAWTVLREDDAIGAIDLSDIDSRSAWTGFAFRRDVWGQGLAREALGAVIVRTFGAMGLTRLTARTQTGNDRARRLLEASGFQAEGALPDVLRDGERRTRILYGLSRSAIKNGV